MDCAKGTAVAGLNDDMMVEILARVPVKDVRRSKCVSKPWRDLIDDPLHRKKLPQTLEGFFHGGGASGHCNYGHFTSLSGSGESAPPVDPSFSFLTAKLPGVERLVLLDSCNGLLLFGCIWENKSGYIVCNPATEELVIVPASSGSCPAPVPEDNKRDAHTYLMFDPAVSSNFNLVQMWESRSKVEVEMVHSYSSEARAWRSSKWERGKDGSEWELWDHAIIEFKSSRAFVNGLLHFTVYDVDKEDDLIVAVDGEGKICSIIPLPGMYVSVVGAFIGQSQGHLHCVSRNVEFVGSISYLTDVPVWVLEDYDTQEWILKHNVSYRQLFGPLSSRIYEFDFVAFHPDHNSIILAQRWDQKLVSYYMDSKELHALRSPGGHYLFIAPYVPCFMELPVLATMD